MQIEKFNQWLMLAANIGVLAGIFFLAIELQQNTQMMQAQTRDSITAKTVDWQMAIASDFSVSGTWRKGADGETLDVYEEAAFLMIANSSFRLWENEWYQYQSGLFAEEEFEPRMVRWERSMKSLPGYRRLWARQRDTYAADFRGLIDGFISEFVNE